MEAELLIEPLHIRRYYLAAKYVLKLKSLKGNNYIINSLNDLYRLCQNCYWRRKSKPLLIVTHENIKTTPVYCSQRMEMFSLDTWVSSVDLTDVIRINVACVDKAKDSYDVGTLKNLCEKFVFRNYGTFYKIYTDASKQKENVGVAWFDPQSGNNVSKGIWYKTIQPTLLRFAWFEGFQIGRPELVTAFRLRSGHVPLNSFLHLIKLKVSPYCDVCKIVDDVYH
ncbi:hypothetical protein Cfor_09466, partial [Coptotermes formosanus]